MSPATDTDEHVYEPSRVADHPSAENVARGRLLVVFAAICWSTSGFFAKAPLLASWPADERGLVMAFWRALAAAILLLPFVRRPSWSIALVPACISFAVMNAAFLLAMALTTEGVALWLQYSSPLWVYLIGVFVLREPSSPKDGWMIMGISFGVGLILIGQWRIAPGDPQMWTGALWGLVAGLALAGVFLSLRRLARLDTLWVVALCHLAAALLLAPLVLGRFNLPSAPQFAWLFAFGGLQMGLPYVLFTRGVRYLPAHEAACIALFEPLLVSLWVYLAWGNTPEYKPPDLLTWIGGSLILIGLVVRYRR